jgi:hypothetical protein
MIALFWLFLTLSVSPFTSKSRLEAENAALRHQLIVLRRRMRGRVQLTNGDRLFLVQLCRPSVKSIETRAAPQYDFKAVRAHVLQTMAHDPRLHLKAPSRPNVLCTAYTAHPGL